MGVSISPWSVVIFPALALDSLSLCCNSKLNAAISVKLKKRDKAQGSGDKDVIVVANVWKKYVLASGAKQQIHCEPWPLVPCSLYLRMYAIY